METKNEIGITLIALIITVILLVILSAVGISTVYNSKIVEIAIKGAQDYAQEGINENKVLDETGSLIDSVMSNLGGKTGGSGSGTKPGTGGGENPGGDTEQKPTPDPTPEGKTKDELKTTEMAGKYVAYKSAGSEYSIGATYSGWSNTQKLLANDDMKWRILGVKENENKLVLISETLAGNITLQGLQRI